MIHEPRPFDCDEYEARLGCYGCKLTDDPPRNIRIVTVAVRRSWLARVWRSLRRYLRGRP